MIRKMKRNLIVLLKKDPENQNQHHNVKKEGVDAKRRQV